MVSCKLLVLATIVALASAQQGGQGGQGGQYGHGHYDHHVPAHYQFAYSVHDPHTHDVKEQHEARQGDHVQGHYSLVQPDGTTRIVHYNADKHNGFHARVEYKGHAVHPQVHHHHQAPVHHVAPSYHHAAPSHHGAATSHISFSNQAGQGHHY